MTITIETKTNLTPAHEELILETLRSLSGIHSVAAVRHPSDYVPHSMGDGHRFHVRTHNPGSGQCYEVYGVGLEHICDCPTGELADMIANALEQVAEHD